jgi:drug/metabolite transporter (DMT)-like permease
MEARQRELTGFLLGLAAVIMFAGSAPFTRMALESFSPWFITFGRAALATFGAVIALAIVRRPIAGKHVLPAIGAGMLLVIIFPGMMALAFKTIPAAHGGVIMGMLPILTALFAALIDGDRPSPLFWACTILGGILVAVFALRESGFTFSTGDIWLFLACPFCSLGYVISGKLSRHMTGWEVICWALVLVCPITFVGCWFVWEPRFLTPTPEAFWALMYLGLFSMLIGFFAWNIGLAMGGIARVGQVQLLQTFFTLGLSALLVGEHIGWDTIAFAAAVVGLVALARKAKVRKLER